MNKLSQSYKKGNTESFIYYKSPKKEDTEPAGDIKINLCGNLQ